MSTITGVIGSLGFPITMCIYMAAVNNKTVKENTETTNRLCTLMENLINKLNKE